MNYDKIILELMSRVQMLEEQMGELKAELQSHKSVDEDEECDNEQGEFTRSQARDKAIKMIQAKFPDYYVEKASRSEGSGIKIIKPDKSSDNAIIIKFYHSKTHEHRTSENSWHSVNLNEIIGTIFNYCLFSVADKNGDCNYFLYKPAELGIYRDENRSVNNDILHLYFVVKDGKATEIREKTIDVTDHLNNWDILK